MNLKTNHFIIAGGMIPLQSMSIFFWIGIIQSTITAPYFILVASGIAVSIMIEFASLWLWYKKESFFAVIASFIVIGGAFYHISSKSFDDLNRADSINKKQSYADTIHKALENANSKGDWYKTTQKSIDGLTMIVASMDNEKASDSNKSKNEIKKIVSKKEAWFKITLLALTVFILQYAQIRASIDLREKEQDENKNDNKKQTEQKQEQKQEQPQKQQQNTVEQSKPNPYACKVKTELDKYMDEKNVDNPSSFMKILFSGTDYSESTIRGFYTKLNYACKGTVGGLKDGKIQEIEERLNNLNSN